MGLNLYPRCFAACHTLYLYQIPRLLNLVQTPCSAWTFSFLTQPVPQGLTPSLFSWIPDLAYFLTLYWLLGPLTLLLGWTSWLLDSWLCQHLYYTLSSWSWLPSQMPSELPRLGSPLPGMTVSWLVPVVRLLGVSRLLQLFPSITLPHPWALAAASHHPGQVKPSVLQSKSSMSTEQIWPLGHMLPTPAL